MTQTIRIPEGDKKLWILSDYSQYRRCERTGLVEWHKITQNDFLAVSIPGFIEDLAKFDKGYAWFATYADQGYIFETEREARDWAYSRDC